MAENRDNLKIAAYHNRKGNNGVNALTTQKFISLKGKSKTVLRNAAYQIKSNEAYTNRATEEILPQSKKIVDL